MYFLNPWFFLLSIFIAAVILFYFFRKQYVEKTISSNFFWEQVLNEWQASPWLKKLQQNLLFWLQLLALLLLMFSLVRPFWYENAVKGEHIILVIDPSATMSAKFENSSRFETAKKEMLTLVDRLGEQEVTLIKAGEKPEILLNQESDLTAIRKQINNLQLTYEHEQMEKAMNLAVSLASNKDTAIHIYSDGVTKEMVSKNMKEHYVEVHNIGEDSGNLSLISFGVASFENQITGIAVIENQASEEKEINIVVKAEEEKFFEQKVSIAGGQQLVIQIPSLPEKPYYEALISNEDGYAADNQATSIFTESNPKVYTIGEVNSFAVKGFQTIGAELLQTNNGKKLNENGILVVEGSDINDLPRQPIIFFNNNKEKVKLKEKLTAKEDQLLQYVDYEKIYIDSAVKAIEGDWETILRSGDNPLVQKGQVNGEPIIIVNFSLSDSDWPLQPGFPIFLYNSYQWLSQQTGFLGYFSPGEEKWININEGKQKWEVFNQQDENLYSFDLTKESFRAPIIPGTYQAVSGDKIYYFSVLLDDREKQAKVETAFTWNELQVYEKGNKKSSNDKLWIWFAVFALVFIALEWEVYRRGHRV
ncbi:BatA and WFA domain-containing protein [Bacillus sp. FJAT-49705]|uniref:BatA and WFA domain-containing protein n=1 Tax=Cytobacillus citreus TaxID=2833586 RepID=A0ABS5NN23_9BACI|nr:BatA and WFA domain-containing protein [Cytobacillus citreus]MBS4189200.1 BatA and WFA domain-containing protein [Cytobacillus citreus]